MPFYHVHLLMIVNQIISIMKKSILFIFIACSFWGCKEDQKKKATDIAGEKMADSTLLINEDTDETTNKSMSEIVLLAGVFIRSDDGKKGEECQCNCVEVNFEQHTSLCIDEKNELSIEARFEKTNDGSLNVFYVGSQNENNNADRKIPWEKFDTSVPIATIAYSSDETFTLDWKGFSIDEEIAVDYAIYGKKNLEGNYVRK